MIKYLMRFRILCAGSQSVAAAFVLALLLFSLQNVDNWDRYDLLQNYSAYVLQAFQSLIGKEQIVLRVLEEFLN